MASKIESVRIRWRLLGALVFMLCGGAALSTACGNHNSGLGAGDNGTNSPAVNDGGGAAGDDGSLSSSGSSGGFMSGSSDSGGPPATCASGTGWSCNVNPHCGNSPTTLTGKVYDPAGKNPLYNVVVFIPNDVQTLPKITQGTNSCNTCDVSVGDYVVAGTTDATGTFTLKGVPTGKGVPVVVQVGKWRRVIPVTTADCKTTTTPTGGQPGALRLPRNRMEGDMPQMAVLTGGYDDLGCFMKRVGLDDTEFSAPGGGRLDVYQGLNTPANTAFGGPANGLSRGAAGDCTNANCPLWSSKTSLEKYDIVLLSCEGGEAAQTKTPAHRVAMHEWLGEGGKVFATHYQYTWFKYGPSDFVGVANWIGPSNGIGTGNFTVDTSFPKGIAFQTWLNSVGAATGASIALNGVANSVSAVNKPTTQWIYDPNGQVPKYLSFGTPVGGVPRTDAGEGSAVGYCGKAVFSDLHVANPPSGDVPAACMTGDLSPQEKALEFLFFDLSACVADDSKPPPPVPPSPPPPK